jgi:hypothetical protein
MKAARILLRLMVLAGVLIVLWIPKPFVAQGSGCGLYEPDGGLTPCPYDCTDYYQTFTQYCSKGPYVLEQVMYCECCFEGADCGAWYSGLPVYDPSLCCLADGQSCGGGGTCGTGGEGCCSGICHGSKKGSGTCGECYPNGQACLDDDDCCSGYCDNCNSKGACTCQCYSNGSACTSSQQCCSGLCIGGACESCAGQNQSCASAPCCSPLLCDSGTETCLACVNNGSTCTANSQCCSGNCSGGTCVPACLANGSSCSSASQCCGGACAPQGYCMTCQTSGEGCTAGWQCCSGNCVIGPYNGSCS